MPNYRVTIPIAGAISTEVEADNKREAIEEALDKACSDDGWLDRLTLKPGWDIEELETYEAISEGNVIHVTYSKTEALEEE